MTWYWNRDNGGELFWVPDVPGAWHVPLPLPPSVPDSWRAAYSPSAVYPPPPEIREARVYRTGLADAGRCWCPAAHLPPFCSRPEPPGLAARFQPPRWLAVAAMILALLTAEAWMAVLLTAAIRLVTS